MVPALRDRTRRRPPECRRTAICHPAIWPAPGLERPQTGGELVPDFRAVDRPIHAAVVGQAVQVAGPHGIGNERNDPKNRAGPGPGPARSRRRQRCEERHRSPRRRGHRREKGRRRSQRGLPRCRGRSSSSSLRCPGSRKSSRQRALGVAAIHRVEVGPHVHGSRPLVVEENAVDLLRHGRGAPQLRAPSSLRKRPPEEAAQTRPGEPGSTAREPTPAPPGRVELVQWSPLSSER